MKPSEINDGCSTNKSVKKKKHGGLPSLDTTDHPPRTKDRKLPGLDTDLLSDGHHQYHLVTILYCDMPLYKEHLLYRCHSKVCCHDLPLPGHHPGLSPVG